jgi:hypothetical protein
MLTKRSAKKRWGLEEDPVCRYGEGDQWGTDQHRAYAFLLFGSEVMSDLPLSPMMTVRSFHEAAHAVAAIELGMIEVTV